MTEKKNKPELRFDGFNDAWEERKFSEITFLAAEKNKDNLPLESYSISNERGFIPQNEQFENGGTMRDADKSMYYIVSSKSFAYNPARINVGSIGYYNLAENVIVSSLYEVFKTTKKADDRFLWHWFKRNDFQKMIEQYQEGGVRLYFYYDKLCMCSVALPSVKEQEAIGAVLDNLDNLITLYQRKYEKTLNFKKAMLEKMFVQNGENTPEIRFKGFTDAWEERSLASVAEFNPKDELPDTFKYVDLESVVGTEMISHREEKKEHAPSRAKRLAKRGDLFYQTVRPYQMNNYLFEKPEDNYVFSTGYAQMRSSCNGYYLLCLVQTSLFVRSVLNKCTGTSYPAINSDDLAAIEILISKEELEQERISNFFKNFDNLITLYQREMEKLQTIKKSCLEKMFV